MRFRAVLLEAWRNVVTGTARTRRTAIAAALSICLLAGADMAVTRQLVERADEFVRSGAAVKIVTAKGRVDAGRCDRLVQLPGVTASGALRSTSLQLTPAVLTHSPLPVTEVSSGFPAVVGASIRTAGVLLGPEAVEALDATSTGALSTTAGSVRIGGHYSYPDDGRRPGLSYAALAPAPADQPFDECWVQAGLARDLTGVLLTTVLSVEEGDDPPATGQLNPTRGTSFDGEVLFAQRITRFAGPCAAVLGFALGFAGIRSRRLSFASALHAGASPRDLRRIVGVETVVWVTLSAALAVPMTRLIGQVLDDDVAWSLVRGATTHLALGLSGFVGAWAASATIHERFLFHYFKAR